MGKEIQEKRSEEMFQKELDRKADRKKIITSLLPIAGMLILILFFGTATGGQFVGSSNLKNLVSQGFTMILIAAGAAFIYASGSIDMSLGAVFGLTEIVAGLLMSSLQVNGWIALLAAIATGVLCTSVTALTYSLLNVPPFVASLCMLNICNGIISWVVEDGEVYITYSFYKQWDRTVIHGLTLLVVLVVCFFLFTRTRVGKDAKALGGNRMTAVISGIKKTRALWICYAIMGLCIGLAGFFGMVRSCRVSAGSNTLALNTITAVVLGGFPLRGGAKAHFHAAITGAVTVTILNNGLTLLGLDPAVTLAVKGVLFLAVVALGTDRSKGKLVK